LKLYKEEIPLINEMMIEYKQMGGKSVIVSDLDALACAKKNDLNITISSCATVNNVQLAKFYRDQGATRIIFPRDMQIREMREIVEEVPQMEFEAFIMNNPCKFTDGNCLGLHDTNKGSLCKYLDEVYVEVEYIKNVTDNYKYKYRQNEYFYKQFFANACGLCAIYELIQSGIAAVKIVGRLLPTSEIIDTIVKVADCIRKAEKANNERNYFYQIRHIYDNAYCRNGLNCYYPETFKLLSKVREDEYSGF
jgi:putative protease